MNNKIKRLVEDLREPTLIYTLESKRDRSPNIKSYVGGTPYTENFDKIPVCRNCKCPMNFVFQLNIPCQKGSELFAFYYCFSCSIRTGNKGFKLKKYSNPSLEKMRTNVNNKSKIQYAEFDFTPQWSLPDWETLSIIKPDVCKSFLKEFQEEAEIEYENVKEELLDSWVFDSFSFYGGYPSFLGFPQFPQCDDCQEKMELWIQVDSDEKKGLLWKDYSCLQIFKCKNGSDNFKILIQ